MAARLLVDGVAADRVSVLDRGFGYGDGLFESIRMVGTRAPLWARHMQRLTAGCERLLIPAPDPDQLWHETQQVRADMAHAVVRITVTRGIGERGYAPPATPRPTRVVAAFPPPPVGEAAIHGVRMRVCRLRLAEQPRLAGVKHLNRLEQVLARAEWNDPAMAEGLLCDMHGHAISATAANLFAVVDGVPVTPALERCGVAGVLRAELLEALPRVEVRELPLAECLRASELFLSSSVRGILPVQAVADKVFAPGPVARAMQAHWHELGYPMEQA